MDIDMIRKIEVIDLCTPNMDISDTSDLSTTVAAAAVLQTTSPSNMMSMMRERFPNLHHRLSILPCYPGNFTQNCEGRDPLLPNIPRM